MQADVAALSARVEAQAADERAERIRMRSMLSEFAADDEDDAEYEDDAALAAAPHIVVKLAEPAGQAEDAATGDAASEVLAERREPQVVQSGFDEAVDVVIDPLAGARGGRPFCASRSAVERPHQGQHAGAAAQIEDLVGGVVSRAAARALVLVQIVAAPHRGGPQF